MQYFGFIAFVFVFLIGAYFYTSRSLILALRPKFKFIVYILNALFILQIMFTFFAVRIYREFGEIPKFLKIFEWIGYTSLGFLLLMIACFFIADCYYLVNKFIYKKKRHKYIEKIKNYIKEETINQNRRSFIHTIALGVASVFTGWAFYNARSTPNIKNVEIPLKKLHPDLKDFSIVQITDLHVGQTIGKDYVERVVEKINSINADIIVITGDLVDGFVDELRDWVSPLGQLKSKLGVYYVNGNHEYYWDADGWGHHIEELGAVCLKNEHRVLQIGGAKVVLAGVTDLHAERFDEKQKCDVRRSVIGAPRNAALKILLAHQPKTAFEAVPLDYYDLQLSGHTHGGQLWPGTWLIPLIQPFCAGLHFYKNLMIYVSRGTGYWGPPARLGSDSEITHITFKQA